MSKISDELRDIAVFARECGIGSISHRIGIVVDRIDSEMVELPRDANGETLHLSDKAYDRKGNEQTVLIFELYGEEEPTWTVSTDYCASLSPSVLTHERPDSLKRIIDDIETFGNEADINDTTVEFLCKIQERIYMLAKKEG